MLHRSHQRTSVRQILLYQFAALELIYTGTVTRYKIVHCIVRINRHMHKIFGRIARFGLYRSLRNVYPLRAVVHHHITGSVILYRPTPAGNHIQMPLRGGHIVRGVGQRTLGLISATATDSIHAYNTFASACSPHIAYAIGILHAFLCIARNTPDSLRLPIAVVGQIVAQCCLIHRFSGKGIDAVVLKNNIFHFHFRGIGTDIIRIHQLTFVQAESNYTKDHGQICPPVVHRDIVDGLGSHHILGVQSRYVFHLLIMQYIYLTVCIGNNQHIGSFVVIDTYDFRSM